MRKLLFVLFYLSAVTFLVSCDDDVDDNIRFAKIEDYCIPANESLNDEGTDVLNSKDDAEKFLAGFKADNVLNFDYSRYSVLCLRSRYRKAFFVKNMYFVKDNEFVVEYSLYDLLLVHNYSEEVCMSAFAVRPKIPEGCKITMVYSE